MPEPVIIRIRQYQFALTRRYSAGTVLTEGEAQALDSLKAENVRNNVDGWVAAELKRLPGGATLLLPSQVDALQKRISDYDKGYQFNERRKGSALRPGAIELEARQLVILRISEDRGIPIEEIKEEDYQGMFEILLEDPELQAQARANVAAKEAVAQQSLEDL